MMSGLQMMTTEPEQVRGTILEMKRGSEAE
jgi:hypothetical protein